MDITLSHRRSLNKSRDIRRGKTFVSLEELAEPYSRNLIDHLQSSDRQGTSASSRFLEVCRKFSRGASRKDQLLAQTARLGFVNVTDGPRPAGTPPTRHCRSGGIIYWHDDEEGYRG
jgi:hypothetical protein